jgi:hypothetical protein
MPRDSTDVPESTQILDNARRGAPHAGHGRGREAEPWSDWERAARAIQAARTGEAR